MGLPPLAIPLARRRVGSFALLQPLSDYSAIPYRPSRREPADIELHESYSSLRARYYPSAGGKELLIQFAKFIGNSSNIETRI